jgi:hypothetical protein
MDAFVGAGYVIEPYHSYPDLLDLILNEIKTQQLPSMRMEVVKVLGILGALDPYTHKLQQIGIQRVGFLTTRKLWCVILKAHTQGDVYILSLHRGYSRALSRRLHRPTTAQSRRPSHLHHRPSSS